MLKLKTEIERVDFNSLEQIEVSFGRKRNDELKLLEYSFNEMIHKLVLARQALYQINKDLDLLVKVRTFELEKTNSKLKESEKNIDRCLRTTQLLNYLLIL